MTDMDAFEFIKIVETIQDDIPIVLVSQVYNPGNIYKAIDYEASDVICSPTVHELKLIWKYVVFKKLALRSKHRKGVENSNERTTSPVNDSSESAPKKPRWRWTGELHQKFIFAVNQLGLDRATPKKILELMDVPNLAKQNVSSHLQKFREHVKGKGKANRTETTLESRHKHAQNQKLPVMQQPSSSRPILDTNQSREFELKALNERKLKSQPPGQHIVPEQSSPGFHMQNCACVISKSQNSDLIGQSNVHLATSVPLAGYSNCMTQSNVAPIPQNSNLTGQSNVRIATSAPLAGNSSFVRQSNAAPVRQNSNLIGQSNACIATSAPLSGNSSYARQSNTVPTSQNSNLIGQCNVRIATSASLAGNSSNMRQSPNYTYQNNGSIITGVDNMITSRQNPNHIRQNNVALMHQARNISATMQQNYSVATNQTDGNFNPMARNQLNVAPRYAPTGILPRSSVPVAHATNFLSPENAFSLLSQMQNCALNGNYANQNPTAVENNWAEGINVVGVMQNDSTGGNENIGVSYQVENDLNTFTCNDEAGSPNRVVNVDAFIAEILNLDAEGEEPNK